MNNALNITVCDGYTIIKKQKITDLISAYKILTSQYKKYSSATKNGDRATLTKYIIKCPFCGCEKPAYHGFLGYGKTAEPCELSSEMLEMWAGVQATLFDDIQNTIYIQSPIQQLERYACPRCGEYSEKATTSCKVYLKSEQNKIYIHREINDFEGIMSVKWAGDIELEGYPLIEKMIFDFENGACLLQLENAEKNIVANMNVTTCYQKQMCSVLAEVVSTNKTVKQKLKQMFERITGCDVPFSEEELDIDEWVHLAVFTGFSRRFYDDLPLDRDNCIAYCFCHLVPKLRNPQMAMEQLEKSGIPFCKSVKRVFAEQPGLLFYIDECRVIYDLISDINLFVKFLNTQRKYLLLADLHKYSGIRSFLEDYCQINGKHAFIKLLCNKPEIICSYAVRYNALSEYEKQRLRKDFSKKKMEFFDAHLSMLYENRGYSLPISMIPDNIPDCVINSFSFKWLRGKKQFQRAGEQLENCLGSWGAGDNPVVVVCEKDHAVAAIEVANKCVCQVHGYQNSDIDEYSNLGKAIDKWIKKFDLEFDMICF